LGILERYEGATGIRSLFRQNDLGLELLQPNHYCLVAMISAVPGTHEDAFSILVPDGDNTCNPRLSAIPIVPPYEVATDAFDQFAGAIL
jgi:hypothetical protein